MPPEPLVRLQRDHIRAGAKRLNQRLFLNSGNLACRRRPRRKLYAALGSKAPERFETGIGLGDDKRRSVVDPVHGAARILGAAHRIAGPAERLAQGEPFVRVQQGAVLGPADNRLRSLPEDGSTPAR